MTTEYFDIGEHHFALEFKEELSSTGPEQLETDSALALVDAEIHSLNNAIARAQKEIWRLGKLRRALVAKGEKTNEFPDEKND